MTDKVTASDIKGVISGFATSIEEEFRTMTQEEVAARWYFRFTPEDSLEINIYKFSDMLNLYSASCRRWESMHNGSSCVVERVRDKYLMPKIKEFSSQMQEAYGLGPQAGLNVSS